MAPIPPLLQAHLVVVDSNVLIDLAAQENRVWEAVEVLREKVEGCRLIVFPIVLNEVRNIASNDMRPEVRGYANDALAHMFKKWGMCPEYVPLEIAFAIGQELRDRQLIPYEERNDAGILASAALFGAGKLLTRNWHLLNVEQARAELLVLDRHNLKCPLIMAPDIVRKALR